MMLPYTKNRRTEFCTRSITYSAVALCAFALAGNVYASSSAVMQDEKAASPDRFHIDLSADLTTAHFFRGYRQENQGLIVQPNVRLTYDLSDQVSVYAGAWNAFYSEATRAETSDSVREHWYETDLYAGVNYAVNRWNLGAKYTAYTSPSDAFDAFQEIALIAAYDDSAHWDGDFALNPSVQLAFETSSDTADGQDRGIYLELGVAPSFTCKFLESRNITLTVPASVGLSVDDYYQDATGDDHTFGFFKIGVDASMPIENTRHGMWTVSGGVHLLYLDGRTEEVNSGESTEVIARIGVSASF